MEGHSQERNVDEPILHLYPGYTLNEPIVNKTARAIITIAVLIFAIAVIVFCVLKGDPANSLHQSAMSWSYMLIIFTMVALGIDSAAISVISMLREPSK